MSATDTPATAGVPTWRTALVTARRRASVLVVAAALVGACSGGGAGDDAGPGEGAPDDAPVAVPEEFTGDDFYAVPDPLPAGDHGDLIRYDQLEPAAGDGAEVTTWRVMYLSESLAGEPVAVTGTVSVPGGEAPPGGRDLVTDAHGTTGIADECAPSRLEDPREGGLARLAAGYGYVLASTDYEGLGTPGRHPYLVGESEGRGVLDAARAADQLPGVELSGRVAISGYSQGGHGALWAGQLAEEWTPELEVVGTFAGAPATELPVILAAAGRMNIAGFLYMIVAGFEAAYPEEADPSLILTPAGVEALDAVDEGCTAEVLAQLGALPADELLKPDLAATEPWASLAAANDPGRVATDAPVLIVHSAADDVVPAALSDAAFARMCGLGQQVERRVYDAGQGHGAAAPQAYADGFAWIADRFAGEPAVSTCP